MTHSHSLKNIHLGLQYLTNPYEKPMDPEEDLRIERFIIKEKDKTLNI